MVRYPIWKLARPCWIFFFKTVRGANVAPLIEAAWRENAELTLRAIFQLRDCRGGKGEKQLFYDCFRWLIDKDINIAREMIPLIPHYGTYKDLLVSCANTKLEYDMLKFYAGVLADDIARLNKHVIQYSHSADPVPHIEVTLAAKWAPTENGALDRKYNYVKKLTGILHKIGITNMRDYRREVIVPLRKYIEIVESKMCAGEWTDINFGIVPSRAMLLHNKAFKSHAPAEFGEYLANVRAGKSTIKSGQVFPHELVKYYIDGGEYSETIEFQWREIVKNAARTFTQCAIPIVDVSGSMVGTPMCVAIALGLIIAEIAQPPFRDLMLTFTSTPSLFTVVGATLQEKVNCIRDMPWGQNTNLSAAFDLILDLATKNNLPAHELPSTLYIFSDMQFDEASPSNNKTNFEYLEAKYAKSGYRRPDIIFWNLSGNCGDFPVEQHIARTALVSGFSQSMISVFMTGGVISPYAVMLATLCTPRYDRCVVSN